MHPIPHKLNWASGFHYHSQVDHLQICFIIQAHPLNYRFASPNTHPTFPVMHLMATSNSAYSKLNMQFFPSNLVCLQHFPITSVQYMTNSAFQFLSSNFMTFLDSLLSAIPPTCCINDQHLTENHKSLVSTLPLSTIHHYFLKKHFLCLIIPTTPLPFPSVTFLDRMVSVNVSYFLSQSLFPQR